MLHFTVALGEPGAYFLRIVFEGAVPAFIRDPPVLAHDVEPLRPSGVGIVGAIGHFIDAEWHGEFVTLREIIGDGHALFNAFRLRVANIVLALFVGFHLPLVGGMGFANVNGQKIDMSFVIVVELHDVANLAAKGRSSKTAKDEDERAAGGFFPDVEARGAIEGDEASIRCLIADFERAAMQVRKCIANHV